MRPRSVGGSVEAGSSGPSQRLRAVGRGRRLTERLFDEARHFNAVLDALVQYEADGRSKASLQAFRQSRLYEAGGMLQPRSVNSRPSPPP